ncbi:MAG TPA: gluconokinase [Chitinophaga sp.]|uniref:gluconokinase n=1 Tax=Chitinophaga sp. TaxID=1869181 RepID=UPI002CCAAAC6|nr:gluconokinase [Chitinophaga sp.]HVI45929.1 gluconokinase [Chitinophaga sp.]
MSDQTTFIIGVDIGTGSAKTIGLGLNGSVIAGCQTAYETTHPAPGFSEQDPAILLAAVKNGIREVVAKAGQPPAAISFSCAMHSLIAMDAAGQPLTPAIIWADNRSDVIATTLRNTQQGKDIYHHTGTPVHAMSPLCKIRWLKQHLPEVFARAVMFAGIKEYILHHFFCRYVTDHSMASATGMFDIARKEWYPGALAFAGISTAHLPIPVPVTFVLTDLKPAIAAELGIPPETPFIVGGSDGCLAQLGSQALNPGHATLTIGTSGAMRMAGSQPLIDAEGRLFTYLLTDDVYITGGASNNGGVVLQWLVRDFLQQPLANLPSLVDAALQTDAGRLLCMPYLLGERAPVWNSQATAAFIGIQAGHTAAHFVRATLEGICFALLSIRKAMEETCGPVNEISVSGGFTSSRGWVQLLADIFGQPMHLRRQSDASVLGAIMLAAKALNLPLTVEADKEEGTIFQPDLSKKDGYEKKFQQFISLYKLLDQYDAGFRTQG